MPKLPSGFLRALRTPRAAKAVVCVFFACFLALGLVTAGDYGQPWDELDEMDILRMNLWEYARAFGLDESAFEEWAAPNELSLNALMPISQSIERDHGQSALYPLAPVVMSRSISDSARQVLWHMGCWAVFTLGAFALYACCRALGLSRFYGLLAATMLLCSPRFFAEGHYNNKDIALMSLTLCALWQGLALMKKPTCPRAVCFALFGALAANTKLVGLALWGLIALAVLVRYIAAGKLTRRVIGAALVALSGFVALYALLTPAMWRAPMDFFTYLLQNTLTFSRWENYILFRGAVFDTGKTALPWYYLPYMIAATTPLWALLFAAVGQVAAIPTILHKQKGAQRDTALSLPLLLVTLLWLLPLGFAMAARVTVYNGWRHFYFLYGPMLILAAWGVRWLWRRLCRMRPRWLRRAFAVMAALCLLFTGAGIALDHPYQYAYYQPLVDLRRQGDWQELDYWNVSVQNALTTLLQKTEGELAVGYADLWSENGLRRGAHALPDELRKRVQITDDLSAARYVLVNPTYAVFSGFAPSTDMAEVVTLTACDRAIMRIYERTASR